MLCIACPSCRSRVEKANGRAATPRLGFSAHVVGLTAVWTREVCLRARSPRQTCQHSIATLGIVSKGRSPREPALARQRRPPLYTATRRNSQPDQSCSAPLVSPPAAPPPAAPSPAGDMLDGRSGRRSSGQQSTHAVARPPAPVDAAKSLLSARRRPLRLRAPPPTRGHRAALAAAAAWRCGLESGSEAIGFEEAASYPSDSLRPAADAEFKPARPHARSPALHEVCRYLKHHP